MSRHHSPILRSSSAAEPELLEPDDPAAVLSRRGFLKAAGFTFGGLAAAGCSRAPVNKAVPLLVQPETITPGCSDYYASTCGACPAGCGLLISNRDGRPVKLEGNPDHPLSRGGLCAVGQASILGVYDSRRLSAPRAAGRAAQWPEVDALVVRRLEEIRRDGKPVRFLTGTVTSPSMQAAIRRFLATFKDARHVTCDPISCSAILDAHEKTHGVRRLPRYHFEQAEVIVGVDADFLGTWVSPVEYTVSFSQVRRPESEPPRFAYHVQIESRLSLTGSKADRRIRLAPSEITAALRQLAAGLSTQAAGNRAAAPWIREVAERLHRARGQSLIVCGSNRLDDQLLCNEINHLLGNYGTTIDIEHGSLQRQGCDRDVHQLIEELRGKSVGALFIHGVNPVYSLPEGRELAEAIRRVPLSVSFSPRIDETSEVMHFVCPDHHFLESWSDAEPVDGCLSLQQPALAPLGQTRGLIESLSAWLGQPQSAYDLVREYWYQEVFPRARQAAAAPSSGPETFQHFWDTAVHDGWVAVAPRGRQANSFQHSALGARAPALPSRPAGDLTLVLYAKPSMLDGQHAYNPWLQELPDPISKVAWDNYACVSPDTAAQRGLSSNDVVRIEVEAGRSIELPILIQPGQADGTVAVALGYGTQESARFAGIGPKWLQARPSVGDNGRVGVNAAPLVRWQDGALQYGGGPVRVSRVGRRRELALAQQYHRLEVPHNLAPAGAARRPNVHETTLAAYSAPAPHEGRSPAHASPGGEHSEPGAKSADLWPPDHAYAGHKWAMAIDLTACTGCSACVIACQVENNIPVVGQDEVRRQREMHWMRIDRYYTGDEAEPDVAFQPMLCQHCENAPCETVCPVLATVHSEDGLNQQVYNRCVGTRYCANNCPYKVRRFNWFDYPHGDLKQNLVLNPDVTVRTRGVMEKCSFCAQRIQAARLEAKRKDQPMADGDVQPACQQTCAAGAIVFGDINDPESRVSRLARAARSYRVLEELNVKPAVNYLAIVRNRDESNAGSIHG